MRGREDSHLPDSAPPPPHTHLPALPITLAPLPGARFARARTDSAEAIGAEAGTTKKEDDRPPPPGSASKLKHASPSPMYAQRRMGGVPSPGGGGGGAVGGLLGRLPRGRSAGMWLVVSVSFGAGGGGGARRAPAAKRNRARGLFRKSGAGAGRGACPGHHWARRPRVWHASQAAHTSAGEKGRVGRPACPSARAPARDQKKGGGAPGPARPAASGRCRRPALVSEARLRAIGPPARPRAGQARRLVRRWA